MLIAFTLSMPNVGSWDGKWSNADKLYVRVCNLSKKLTEKILANKSYYYNFGDGWGASVSVRLVDAKEAAKLRKKTKGFCGYDWMVDEIITYQKIYGSNPKPNEKSYATLEEAENAA